MSDAKHPFSRDKLLPLLRASVTYVVAAILALTIAILILQTWRGRFDVPWAYVDADFYGSGDSFFSYAMVKGLIENGSVTHNPNLGAPFGMTLLDFPITGRTHLLALKVLGWIYGDFGRTVNAFYLLTFPMIAICATAVARVIGLRKITSVAIALCYTFLPFHFIRGQTHLFFAAYYVIPLAAIPMIWLALGDRAMFKKHPRTRLALTTTGTISVIICIAIALTETYFAAFSFVLICFAGVYAALRARAWQPLIVAAVLDAIILLTLLLNLSPSLLYHMHNGPNATATNRFISDADEYGLRIAQMVLPITGHRIGPLADIKARYVENFRANENDSAALGIVGTMGLLILLVIVVLPLRTSSDMSILRVLAALSLVCILIGEMGGFGSVFNLLITPLIRSYNRLSIFIGLFALLAVGWLIDRIWDRYQRIEWMKFAAPGAIALLVLLAVFDQTSPSYVPDYDKIQRDFDSDDKFAKSIEQSVPAGSMIVEFPPMPFPEAPVVLKMHDYQLFRPYLHTTKLRYSYGAMKGREFDGWQKNLNEQAQKGLGPLIRTLVDQGFRGLCINRDGLNDANLERSLTVICGKPPIISPDARMIYFDFEKLGTR